MDNNLLTLKFIVHKGEKNDDDCEIRSGTSKSSGHTMEDLDIDEH